MVAYFKQFFASPVFEQDEDKTNRARVLNSLLVNIVIVMILHMVITPLFVVNKLESSILVTLYLGLVLSIRFLMRRGLAQLHTDLGRISRAADKMQQLLNDLLELSRLGRLMNPPEEVSFEAITREAVELVRGRIEARRIQMEIAPNLRPVYGDRLRLVQVMQNLLDNACKFMGDQPQPRIEIGMHEAGGQPVFFVRDNGLGIDPPYHEQIFDLFDKLDTQSEGTGVGLALVKRIIEVHKGRIWVESAGAGQGAAFYFTLPGQAS